MSPPPSPPFPTGSSPPSHPPSLLSSQAPSPGPLWARTPGRAPAPPPQTPAPRYAFFVSDATRHLAGAIARRVADETGLEAAWFVCEPGTGVARPERRAPSLAPTRAVTAADELAALLSDPRDRSVGSVGASSSSPPTLSPLRSAASPSSSSPRGAMSAAALIAKGEAAVRLGDHARANEAFALARELEARARDASDSAQSPRDRGVLHPPTNSNPAAVLASRHPVALTLFPEEHAPAMLGYVVDVLTNAKVPGSSLNRVGGGGFLLNLGAAPDATAAAIARRCASRGYPAYAQVALAGDEREAERGAMRAWIASADGPSAVRAAATLALDALTDGSSAEANESEPAESRRAAASESERGRFGVAFVSDDARDASSVRAAVLSSLVREQRAELRALETVRADARRALGAALESEKEAARRVDAAEAATANAQRALDAAEKRAADAEARTSEALRKAEGSRRDADASLAALEGERSRSNARSLECDERLRSARAELEREKDAREAARVASLNDLAEANDLLAASDAARAALEAREAHSNAAFDRREKILRAELDEAKRLAEETREANEATLEKARETHEATLEKAREAHEATLEATREAHEATLTSRLADAEEKHRASLDAANAEIAALRSDLAAARTAAASNEAAARAKARCDAELANANARNAALRDRLETTKAKCDALEARLREDRSEDASSSGRSHLEKPSPLRENADASRRVETEISFSTNIASLEKAKKEAESRLAESESRLAESESRLAESEAREKAATEASRESAARAAAANEALRAASADAAEATSDAARLATQVRELKAQAERDAASVASARSFEHTVAGLRHARLVADAAAKSAVAESARVARVAEARADAREAEANEAAAAAKRAADDRVAKAETARIDAEASLRQTEAKRSDLESKLRAAIRRCDALRAEKAAAYRAATSDVATDARTPSEFARLPPPETIGDHGAAVRVAAACCRRLEARLAGCRACVAQTRRRGADEDKTVVVAAGAMGVVVDWFGARGWSSEIKRDGESLAHACLDAEAARGEDRRDASASTPPPPPARERAHAFDRAVRVRGGLRAPGAAIAISARRALLIDASGRDGGGAPTLAELCAVEDAAGAIRAAFEAADEATRRRRDRFARTLAAELRRVRKRTSSDEASSEARSDAEAATGGTSGDASLEKEDSDGDDRSEFPLDRVEPGDASRVDLAPATADSALRAIETLRRARRRAERDARDRGLLAEALLVGAPDGLVGVPAALAQAMTLCAWAMGCVAVGGGGGAGTRSDAEDERNPRRKAFLPSGGNHARDGTAGGKENRLRGENIDAADGDTGTDGAPRARQNQTVVPPTMPRDDAAAFDAAASARRAASRSRVARRRDARAAARLGLRPLERSFADEAAEAREAATGRVAATRAIALWARAPEYDDAFRDGGGGGGGGGGGARDLVAACAADNNAALRKAHVGADRDLRDVVRALLAAEPFAVGDAEAVEDEREARERRRARAREAANDDDASEGGAEGDERATRSGPEGTLNGRADPWTRIRRRARTPNAALEDFVAFAWVWAATAAAECAIRRHVRSGRCRGGGGADDRGRLAPAVSLEALERRERERAAAGEVIARYARRYARRFAENARRARGEGRASREKDYTA